MQPSNTERIVWRPLAAEDAELLHRLVANSQVIRYLMPAPTPLEHIEQVELPEKLGTTAQFPGTGTWIARLLETGEFIGWFELDPYPDSSILELGYRLLPDYWGQGLATEGCSELVRYAFEHLGAERVVAQTMFVNTGSRRVMEKLAMRHTRTWQEEFDDPLPGTEHGEVEYVLTRDEWLALRCT